MSFAWYERAIFAEEFSQYHPSFASIATCLFAARLDCLLEAALAAWDLGIIGVDEERLAWWWIYQVTSCRVQMALAESWESAWARAWLNIAAGMILVRPVCVEASSEVDDSSCRSSRYHERCLTFGSNGHSRYPCWAERIILAVWRLAMMSGSIRSGPQ